MKVNELMIGDIVMAEIYCFDDNTDKEWYEHHPFRITDLSENCGLYMDGRECMYAGDYLDDCQAEDMEDFSPIPLTDEILKANKFGSKCLHILKTNDIEIELCLSKGVPMYIRTDSWHYCLPHPTYVHELQHALRLCGLTELANNFKIE